MTIDKCTYCGKPLDTFLTKVIINTETFRKREDSSVEHMNNCDWTYIEYLCPDCIKIFCDSLKESFEDRVKESTKLKENGDL